MAMWDIGNGYYSYVNTRSLYNFTITLVVMRVKWPFIDIDIILL